MATLLINITGDDAGEVAHALEACVRWLGCTHFGMGYDGDDRFLSCEIAEKSLPPGSIPDSMRSPGHPAADAAMSLDPPWRRTNTKT